MKSSVAILAIMLSGQAAQAWKCPPKTTRWVEHVSTETFVDNVNGFEAYGSDYADVIIDKLTESGKKSKARYSFTTWAGGDWAAVWDKVEQKVVNCKHLVKNVIRYRNCRYYCDQQAVKKCRQAAAVAEIDVYGEDAEIDVSKFVITRAGYSRTEQHSSGQGKSITTNLYQENEVVNQRGQKGNARASVTSHTSGDKASSSTSVVTEAKNVKRGGQTVSGGGHSSASSHKSAKARRHRY